MLVDGDELTRLDLPDVRRADDVERRGLARDHPAALKATQHKGPDALRIAGGVQGRVVHEDE